MIFGAHRGGENGNDAFDDVGGGSAGACNSSTPGTFWTGVVRTSGLLPNGKTAPATATESQKERDSEPTAVPLKTD